MILLIYLIKKLITQLKIIKNMFLIYIYIYIYIHTLK